MTDSPTATPASSATNTSLPPTPTPLISPTFAPGGDLAITIAGLSAPARPGSNLTYHLTALNNGPIDDNSVVITGTLSNQAAFSGSSCPNVSVSGSQVICRMDKLASGATSLFDLQVSVSPQASGDIPFTATISASAVDPQPRNNSAQTDTPIDTVKPTVSWVTPTQNGSGLFVTNALVPLSVTASDNFGVARVRIYRWDKLMLRYVDIINMTNPPYNFNLGANTLYFGWNEIDAEAYDTAGNVSDHQFIFLFQKAFIYLPSINLK